MVKHNFFCALEEPLRSFHWNLRSLILIILAKTCSSNRILETYFKTFLDSYALLIWLRGFDLPIKPLSCVPFFPMTVHPQFAFCTRTLLRGHSGQFECCLIKCFFPLFESFSLKKAAHEIMIILPVVKLHMFLNSKIENNVINNLTAPILNILLIILTPHIFIIVPLLQNL